MSIAKFGQWDQARRAVVGMSTRASAAMNAANKQEAHLFRALVVRAFNTRGKSNGTAWPKIAESTRKKKGSTKPLVDRGDLRNSVVVVVQGDEAFVGVTSKTRNKKGELMANIAAVHEGGKTIVQKRGDKLTVIKIPKRSFLEATAKQHFKPGVVKQRFLARVAVNMGHGWAGQAPAKASAMAKKGIAEAKGKIPKKTAKKPRTQKRLRGAKGRFI